jgi:5'-nucleotidase
MHANVDMTILVTNDDGDSVGLRTLLSVAKSIDSNAYAVIPAKQRSAIGCALTLHKPLRLHKISDGIWAINGTPTDCTLFSLYSEEFKPPELVLSGINYGDNSGMGPLVGSGTIAACWQAALNGIPSIAFSLRRKDRDWRDQSKWGNQKENEKIIKKIIKMLRPKLRPNSFFNVNFPENFTENSSNEDFEIEFVEKFQMKRYKTRVEKRIDPEGQPYYWIMGDKLPAQPETDYGELISGKITITKIDVKCIASNLPPQKTI